MSEAIDQPLFEEYAELNPVVQETDPAVVMHLGMGSVIDRGKVVEVDYPALRSTLRAAGAPEDNADLVVAIEPQRWYEVTHGLHYSESDEYREEEVFGPLIIVGSNPSTKRHGPDYTQKVLQHELSHHIDSLNDILTSPHRRLYDAANKVNGKGMEIAVATTGVSALKIGSVYFSPIPPGMSAETANRLYGIFDQASTIGMLAATATLVTAGAFYQRTPGEKRARQAEQVTQAPFLRIEDIAAGESA